MNSSKTTARSAAKLIDYFSAIDRLMKEGGCLPKATNKNKQSWCPEQSLPGTTAYAMIHPLFTCELVMPTNNVDIPTE